jgi:hypothetical protein
MVLACVALGAGGHMGMQAYLRARDAKLAAAEELAAADRSRMEENLREAKTRREAETALRDERDRERIQRALAKLAADRCEGALELGRLNARDHIGELTTLLWSERDASARGCAASALVKMGEKTTALAAYVAWAGGSDSTLQRFALAGFGEIGPEAAGQGMPFLTEAMTSPDMDVRRLASLSISKVQPSATP